MKMEVLSLPIREIVGITEELARYWRDHHLDGSAHRDTRIRRTGSAGPSESFLLRETPGRVAAAFRNGRAAGPSIGRGENPRDGYRYIIPGCIFAGDIQPGVAKFQTFLSSKYGKYFSVQREGLFRTLFESSPDAILIEDENGNILDCNPAAAALHRIPRELLIGKLGSELLPSETRTPIGGEITERIQQYEGLSLTTDGESIHVSVRTSRIDYDGKPAMLLHVRDITDRKRFEQNLQASHDELEKRVESRTADLARANEILRSEIAERNRAEGRRKRLEEEIRGAQRMEAVGRLAGGVAHDFNNLLTVVIGRCEVILDRLNVDSPMLPEIRLIHDAASKAASVTRQLLAFGRKQVLQPRIIDLNVVISNMKAILLSLISENIQLGIRHQPDLWRVEADRGQLEQVIMNLVVNAIDAMPRGGKLDIETFNVDLKEPRPQFNFPIKPGQYAVVSVRDSGQGMNPTTLSHVFEPFFTTKGETKGTGLGLSTVYGIVKQSGGYILAESTEGEGSTFQVYLPGMDRVAEPIL